MERYLSAVLCGSLLLGMASIPAPTFAHGGEDHGDEAAPKPAVLAPASAGVRLELQSPDVELLGILHDGKLTLYADHFATNEPIPSAKVELESKGQKLALQTEANGMAEVAAGWLSQPGHYEITATVQAKGVNDLLIGTTDIPPPDAGTVEKPWWNFWGSQLQDMLLPQAAWAHGGEDHGDEAKPTAVPLPATARAVPTRLPDGSVFMPKPAQHLLGVRTVLGKVQAVAQTVQLNGTVVADPNASGRVQPSQAGRVIAPPAGFPAVGSRVESGQVLAHLEPSASNIDKGNQQEKIAEARSELALADKNAARLESIAGVIPRMEVDAARSTADTLTARLQALQGSLVQQPEALRSPVSGIISAANIMQGQQVAAGETLFEIIDPNQLQVEALAYDPALGGQVTGASALTADQKTLPLEFVGSSQQLRQQALPLWFRIRASNAHLSVGQALSVAVQTQASLQGIPVPASSVVKNSQQESVVWTHATAERFVPHKVTVLPLDADMVVVTDGLSGTVRVVTQGAALLPQVH
ncbi:MAG: efflux RND transporter periplasmic adaptor subunit [Thiothrix sp.]|uniref:efflux RND transporter periplasmic adaptor subunit n=1 Tax=Thiothrix sp. TaxID=1032 RepID=UPI00263084BF|nr:HlyD family efflux transporter periplasmic adaptor subunit [Thiothrix sp.]MDD5395449.1 efflux RND transporter periplasmic adaptor subunit [Thiothrix sp.]